MTRVLSKQRHTKNNWEVSIPVQQAMVAKPHVNLCFWHNGTTKMSGACDFDMDITVGCGSVSERG